MKRFSKILTLVLVVVFLFGIFAGCDLIGKDTGKYRSATAITVGSQKITVGKLLDTFNSYYNNYYYYVYYSGWTVEDIFDLAVQSLYTQYMKVEKYTSNSANVHSDTNAGDFVNAKFLTQAQLDYSISYVKYLFFTSFDSSVMDKINAKYDLKDEVTEDTSRDFYKYDELNLAEGEKYADYYLNQNFVNEDMDEYIDKYFAGAKKGFTSHDTDADKLQELYLQSAQVKVDELNERIDVKEGEEAVSISLDEYQEYQKAVVSQFKTTVKNNYGVEFNAFVKAQIEDMIVSAIVNLYNYTVYSGIESTSKDAMIKLLKENHEILVANQQAKYADDISNYETFIEGLTDSSFIYYVPEGHTKDYVFVKNILVPFNDIQKAKLSSLSADIGTSDDDRYVALRNKLAEQIVADDYNSEKDEDGKYSVQVKDLFKVDGDKVVINTEAENKALSSYLNSDGSVTAMDGKTVDETIKELMAQFNTDVGQHSSLYSYVVRVGDKVKDGGTIPNDYKHRWVQEFVDATNDAVAAAKAAGNEENPAGYYGIGVSDYGVHIVYVEGYVKADDVDFESNSYLDTTTTEYRLFKNYFNTQVNLLLNKDLEALKEEYKSEVNTNKVFDKFLKENGLTYDLFAKLEGKDD